MDAILLDKVYSHASVDNQVSILQYLCAVWKVYPSHDAFESCLYRFLPCISQSVEEESGNDDNDGITSTGVDPIMILVRDLLPHVSRQLASQALVPNILNTAARRSRTSVSATATTSSTLRIIHIFRHIWKLY